MKITERHNDYRLYIEFYNYTTAFMHVHGQRHLLLLVAPTDRMFEDGSSFLQCPRRTLPSPSSPFTKPGGQYTKDSVVRKKLCRAIAAFVNVTTFSGLAMIGHRNILHL